MYGVYSVWSGSGLHLSEAGVNGFPIKDFSNGAGLQIEWKGLFAEVEFLHSQGTIGEKEYLWFRFPGNEINSLIGYRFQGRKARHYATVGFGWKSLELKESILEKVSENGVTTVYNHGANRILSKETISFAPEYEFISRMLELNIRADLVCKNGLSSQMYPYTHTRNITCWSSDIEALLHIGSFDLGARIGFGGGSLNEDEALVAEGSGVLSVPFRLEDWYARQMEYITSTRSEASLSL